MLAAFLALRVRVSALADAMNSTSSGRGAAAGLGRGEAGALRRALRDGDTDAATEAMQRYFGLSKQSASMARDSELNFAACGSGA